MEKISHKGVENMSFLESILSCDNIKTEEFHCLADYNCPFVVSWYLVGSNCKLVSVVIFARMKKQSKSENFSSLCSV